MAQGGKFCIKVWEGGHPIWAEIFYNGISVARIDSIELRDMTYAAEKARLEARRVAERMDPKRIDHY